MGVRDFSIGDVIRRNARVLGDRECLVCGELRWDFLRFAREAEALASALGSLGLKKGDRIGIVAHNCHEFLLLYGAAALAGYVMVPVNWRLKMGEIRFVLEDTTPAVVFLGPDFLQVKKDLAGDLSFVKTWAVFGEGGDVEDLSTLQDLLGSERRSLEEVEVTWDDPYLIIHTAAVEGRPRGAVLTHGNLLASNVQAMALMGFGTEPVYLNLLPLFHIAGLNFALHVFHAGGKNVLMSRFDPEEAVRWIEKEGVTVIGTFPPMLTMLLDRAEELRKDLSSLEMAGGLDHPETIQRFQRVTGGTFWVGFGQTETSGFCSLCPFDEKPGSAGKIAPLVRLRIVDDYDRELPPGDAGEIVVRGPLVFQGYWNLEEETRYTFREGWHHTGDIGRLDQEGYLWYVKRKAEKELIKPGGENVYPAEVEKILLQHPEVEEACVFGVPDKEWGEAIKAVCVLKPGSSLQPKALIDFVADRIARYKKPKYITFVSSLPKAEDGSVDRDRVKEEHGGR